MRNLLINYFVLLISTFLAINCCNKEEWNALSEDGRTELYAESRINSSVFSVMDDVMSVFFSYHPDTLALLVQEAEEMMANEDFESSLEVLMYFGLTENQATAISNLDTTGLYQNGELTTEAVNGYLNWICDNGNSGISILNDNFNWEILCDGPDDEPYFWCDWLNDGDPCSFCNTASLVAVSAGSLAACATSVGPLCATLISTVDDIIDYGQTCG